MIETLHRKLIHWFNQNQRDLPWRKEYNPYKIWISEIMLQQTRVESVIDFFNRWIELIPSASILAQTPIEELLKLWEGLGYYKRVRSLHQAAIEIVEKHNGILPNQYDKLITLPGIGPYTAAAISSIAFELPFGVIDGNVKRVLSRIFAWEKPIHLKVSDSFFEDKVKQLIDQGNPRYLNQALMEFGALLCIPKVPRCSSCPVQSSCVAYKKNITQQLPNRIKPIITKQTEFAFFIQYKDKYFLYQRSEKQLWSNFWSVPTLLFSLQKQDTTSLQNYLHTEFPFTKQAKLIFTAPFSYSVTTYRIQVFPIILDFQAVITKKTLFSALGYAGNWLSLKEISTLPLTKPTREFFTKPQQFTL